MKTGFLTVAAVLAAVLLIPGCPAAPKDAETPDKPVLSTRDDFKPENNWPRPMLWSVYENHRQQEDKNRNDTSNWMRESELRANADWVQNNLLAYGYNYIAMDGWGDGVYNQYGYRIKHDREWNYTYREWAQMLAKKGMKLAMYDNPLWLNGASGDAKIQGTDYYIRDITDPAPATWFRWVDVTRPGAEEFVKGNIRHWKESGIDYIKIDFMSWYQSGYDKSMGRVGRTDRPIEHYETALRWIREEADKQGVFISLAMANHYDYAALEAKYCHMIRISDDIWAGNPKRSFTDHRGTGSGGNRMTDPNGNPLFSLYENVYDGLLYYSALTGPGKVMLDGDYMWLNNRWWSNENSEDNKKAIMTLHVAAGGIVSLTDQYYTSTTTDGSIDLLDIYANEDLCDLTKDGFVGKPLSVTKYPDIDPVKRMWYGTSTAEDIDIVDREGTPGKISQMQMENDSHVWWGECADGSGDYIVAMFNRETGSRQRFITFKDMGIESFSSITVRELWKQTSPLPSGGSIGATYTFGSSAAELRIQLPAAGGDAPGVARIYRLSWQ